MATNPAESRLDPGPWLDGGGEAGALMRAVDWARTPVGPPHAWPASLKSTIAMLLRSRHPMFLWWGPDLVQFYNDAYIPSFGVGKHPAAMGQRGRECWQEIWPIIGPQIEDVMVRGKATWNVDQLVPIFRNGRIEEVYWTYGYSPVLDDGGRVGGTLVVCTETTGRVVSERRLRTHHAFLERSAVAGHREGLVREAAAALGGSRYDIPFALIYLMEPGSPSPRLVATSGLESAAGGAREALDRGLRARFEAGGAFPLDGPEGVVGVADLGVDPSAVPGGPWPERVSELLVSPFMAGTLGTGGWIVFGLSPRLTFDMAYGDALRQLTQSFAVALARIEAVRERAAVESERRNLLLQAPFATALVIGPEHRYELTNRRYCEMVGRGDLVGKTYVEAFPELAGKEILAVLDRVYATGERFVAEEYPMGLARPDGTLAERIFKFNLEPLRDAGDRVYGMMVVAADVTELVAARRAVERANAERESLLVEARKARDDAERANLLKDHFLATVSHELRTPLHAMLGWARLLLGGELPADRWSKALVTIERNAVVQTQLVDDLLDVARIVSGKLRLVSERFDAIVAVEAALEAVRPAAQSRGVRLGASVDAASAPIDGDPRRVEQVVWNLLSNGIKFTPKGGTVTLLLEVVGRSVEIVVADTGRGITPELLPHVFDRFHQGEGGGGGGLGLGLAIAKNLVDLHGGTLQAASEGEGKGATFTVRLPLAGDGAELFDGGAHSRRIDASGVAGLRVLVVDDDADSRELLAALLEGFGVTVATAGSAQEALDGLDAASPEIIISDIAMPDEDGYAFLRRLRALPGEAWRRVPVLALTAFARAEDRARTMRAGFAAHVTKPVEAQDLLATLADLRAGSGPRAAGT